MNLVFWIGAFDAVLIAALGVAGAAIKLAGKDSRLFYDRVIPACLLLIGTSAAAGIVMSITRWLSGV